MHCYICIGGLKKQHIDCRLDRLSYFDVAERLI
jgi:hypothetical protein